MNEETFKKKLSALQKELSYLRSKEEAQKNKLQARFDILMAFVRVYKDAFKDPVDAARVDKAARQLIAACLIGEGDTRELKETVDAIVKKAYQLYNLCIKKSKSADIQERGKRGIKTLQQEKEEYYKHIKKRQDIIEKVEAAARQRKVLITS